MNASFYKCAGAPSRSAIALASERFRLEGREIRETAKGIAKGV
jgi:hypothetical protein